MDITDQTPYPERHHSPGLGMDAMADLEDGEDFVALDSGVSVVSSEWRNVSSSGSSSHVEDELTAKDIVNWHEFWDIWISHHPVVMTNMRDITPDYPCCQEVYSIVQFICNIPRSRFHVPPTEQIQVSHELQNFLTQVTQVDAKLLSEDTSLHLQLSSVNGLTIAEAALQAHNAALHLIQEDNGMVPDDYWTNVHDILAVNCARGRLLRSSETWSMQPQEQLHESDLSPAAAMILSVRKLQPHGAIPVFLGDEAMTSDQAVSTNPLFFAAAFSTRSQVASQLRDTDQTHALHCFSIMATRSILTQMNSNGVNMPVFGVMFDRNIVRFHVDWSMPPHEKHISVPIHHVEHWDSSLPPFRDFDLTQPDDSLRVAFILDAIHAYVQYRLTPAVRQRVSHSTACHSKRRSLAEDEVTTEEKVQTWIRSSGVVVEDIVTPL